MLERQKIPDLPELAPPTLEPLLQYVSVELGLDYLSLVDLRELDPPAALGGNLVMLVGTARSEKHLHVSADRLCRWLRTTYKLRPHADGLLGRNELKLKLRRKAKRSKMLAAAGSAQHEDIDDGIRTGWICVNITGIEPHPEDVRSRELAIPAKGFIGFGEASNTVTVVVQMFTEERRAEIELEKLWSEQLEGSKRRARYKPASEQIVALDQQGGNVGGMRSLDAA
jgi:hypothetical protein